MKLTLSVAYAVGVLLRVQALGSEGRLTAAMIAQGCDVPPRFLYRILRRLVDAGILLGTSGPGGGYQLARKAKEINLLEVVLAIEGPVVPSVLPTIHRQHKAALQKVNDVSAQSAERFARDLAKISLATLAQKPAK